MKPGLHRGGDRPFWPKITKRASLNFFKNSKVKYWYYFVGFRKAAIFFSLYWFLYGVWPRSANFFFALYWFLYCGLPRSDNFFLLCTNIKWLFAAKRQFFFAWCWYYMVFCREAAIFFSLYWYYMAAWREAAIFFLLCDGIMLRFAVQRQIFFLLCIGFIVVFYLTILTTISKKI